MEYRLFEHYPLSILFLGFMSLQFVSPFSLGSRSVESGLKCHPRLTIDVVGESVKGGIRAYGYHFPEGYYTRINYTSYRVCICKVTKCLRKCCLQGQIFYKGKCIHGYDFPLQPQIFDQNYQQIYNYDYSKFVFVYGDTCPNGDFFLEPDLEPMDKYYLLENGSLSVPLAGDMVDVDKFCFEHVIGSMFDNPVKIDLRSKVCFLTDDDYEKISELLPIGMIISIPFLLATFLIYSLPELRNLHGKNLISHVGSLLLAYIFLVIVQMGSNDLNYYTCIAFGYLIQFTFLASFCWLNVMCFDIWHAFSGFAALKGEKKSSDAKKYIIYSTYAWGTPAIISATTITLQFAPRLPKYILKPDIGEHRCFFSDNKVSLAFFYGPTAMILLADILFFLLTAIKIIIVKKQTGAIFRGSESGSSRSREASKQRYVLYLKLFLIMGMNWIMEIISWAVPEPQWIWYITDFANTLQGLLIFIIFVCVNRVKKVLITRFCPHLKANESEIMTSTTKASLSRDSSLTSEAHHDVIHMKTLPSKKNES